MIENMLLGDQRAGQVHSMQHLAVQLPWLQVDAVGLKEWRVEVDVVCHEGSTADEFQA